MKNKRRKKKKKMGKGSIVNSIRGPVGHSIQDCQDFLYLVQGLMDEGRIEFCKEVKGQAVNVLQGETDRKSVV